MNNTKTLQKIAFCQKKTLKSCIVTLLVSAVSAQAYSVDSASQNYGTSYNGYSSSYDDNYSSSYDDYSSSYDNYSSSYDDSYSNSSSSYNDNYSTSYNNTSYNSYDTNPYNDDGTATDRLGALIEKKTLEYQQNSNILYTSGDYYIKNDTSYVSNDNNYSNNNDYSSYSQNNYYDNHNYSNDYDSEKPDFNTWLSKGNNRQNMKAYKKYLIKNVGARNVPPMDQMLLTARSWKKCYQSPYEVPPSYLWQNMLPTLRALAEMKQDQVLPADTYIRSVYRNPTLNACAGGASGSKHQSNAAIDLWSDSFELSKSAKHGTQNKLCNFWSHKGQRYDLGLGLYITGAIHIDTGKYRKWGAQFTTPYSSCRSSW